MEGGRQAHEPRRRIRMPAILARFPKLFWHPRVEDAWAGDRPVVSGEDVDRYTELREDLTVWTDDLEPRFRRLDHRAQLLQNQFWRQHVTLIVGGLVATSLGAIQAAAAGGIVGLAVAQATLTGVLAGLAVLVRSRRAQQGYLTARLKAERIKSEFFLFLARVGDYAKDEPRSTLQQRVDDIEAAEDIT
jgi:hypothetical protein